MLAIIRSGLFFLPAIALAGQNMYRGESSNQGHRPQKYEAGYQSQHPYNQHHRSLHNEYAGLNLNAHNTEVFNDQKASNGKKHKAERDRDVFINRLHDSALMYPHGIEPKKDCPRFELGNAAQASSHTNSFTHEHLDENMEDDLDHMDGVLHEEQPFYDSDDDARYHDEDMDMIEEPPLWDPNYYHIFDVNDRTHHTKVNYDLQLIHPLLDDPSAYQEKRQEFDDLMLYGGLDRDQRRELTKGERNHWARCQSLEHISVLTNDQFGSYKGCVYLPDYNIVLYNNELHPRKVERRFYNAGKKYPHMPTFYGSLDGGRSEFRPRRLRRLRMYRNDNENLI